ncbi:RNA-binding domain-containing protein [Pseudomonas sp. SWRI179]|uniref:RNA-binding domain-containing protein n=1 Tax=Pseudomonas sp. SWRI179 TaxID=2745497 RepID=UPI001644CCE2|nr:RNA-binding domain-containing protein [Pseudomonas sp. SWRI179]MBC3382626.1 putative DNA binding domain-containing protein [Pseudomonas sp. SWRI179]
MATESEVSIGGTYLGGTAKRVDDKYASLFNTADLVAIGDISDNSFFRAYEISVRELRRRLEALGYSLNQVHDDIISTLKKGYLELDEHCLPQCKPFLDYACSFSLDQLIDLAKAWKTQASHSYDYMEHLNTSNFQLHFLDFIQGCSSGLLLPSEDIWLDGFHFERLLCEIYDSEEIFELNFTRLIQAGYYKPDDCPIGDDFDETLSRFNPLSFRLREKLLEEESETLEFKSVNSKNSAKTIAQQFKRYLIGFLNSDGGRILFGVTDEGIVEGVKINRDERDELQRLLTATVHSISPSFPQNSIKIISRPLISSGSEVTDQFVVEIIIPKGRPNEMYFSSSGETWVRHGTSTCALEGHKLFVHICDRYCFADNLLSALNQRVHIALEEIRRLQQDGEKYKGELSSKTTELLDLRSNISSQLQLLKENDLLCPICESPLSTRTSFTQSMTIGGKEYDADIEYIQYECGYAVRDDQDEAVSSCSRPSQAT